MVIHALRRAGARERRKLKEYLRRERPDRSEAQVAWVRRLMEQTGAIKHARTVASALAGAALYEFDTYFSGVRESRDLSFMRSLLVWVLGRSH
jgi:geranylgeranyl pyrophosphate synthase